MNAPTPWRDADRIRDIAAGPITPWRAERPARWPVYAVLAVCIAGLFWSAA